MKYKPLGNRVLIKVDAIKTKTDTGLYLPEIDNHRKQGAQESGVIIAVGPHAWKNLFDETPWASVGDRVLFVRYAGHEIKVDGEKPFSYRIVADEDILVKVED